MDFGGFYQILIFEYANNMVIFNPSFVAHDVYLLYALSDIRACCSGDEWASDVRISELIPLGI